MFKNSALRGIFGPKNDDVARKQTKIEMTRFITGTLHQR
jgi:hypothetical protein